MSEPRPVASSEDAFVERRFEAGDEEVLARFYAATRSARGDYRCQWEIKWPEATQRSFACGIDSVQALLLAMRAAHRDLTMSAAYRAGELTYLKQGDLCLPPVGAPVLFT